MKRVSSRPITSLAATMLWMSPRTSLGRRTLASMTANTSVFGLPALYSLSIGMRMPSSNMSVESGDCGRPPMSGRCAMLPA